MQKSKVFSKKLIAIVLAVMMAVSSFFGVASAAFAYDKGDLYHDNASGLGANMLAWVEVADDATLEACLDQLDDFLSTMDWDSAQKAIDDIGIVGKLPSQLVNILGLGLTISLPNVVATTSQVVSININANISSVDGIIDTMFQLKAAINEINGVSGIAGMIGYDLSGITSGISFDTFGNYFHDGTGASEQGYRTSGGSWRAQNSAKYIIRGVLRWLIHDNENLINNALNGDLVLVADGDGKPLFDLYEIIGGIEFIGIDNEAWKNDSNGTYYYKSSNGVVYNIVKAILCNHIGVYEDEANHLKEESSWVMDTEAYKIANFYLQKISFEITYPEYATFDAADEIKSEVDANGETHFIGGRFNDSSIRRYKQAIAAGKFDTDTGKIDSAYATAQGWDPNLVYSQEPGYEGNVLVAQYGSDKVAVTSSDSVYSLIWKALPIVWKTALKPTIELLHVNYNGRDDEEGGSNFDNAFFYWVNEEYQDGTYEWVRGDNFGDNYSSTIVNAWANAVYADYGFNSASEFLNRVKRTLTYDKSRLAKNDKYNWRDINASILFSEIRYSPLADKFFDIQTGPLNLYFQQTGADAVIDFFDNLFANKTETGFPGSLMSQLDDALVTAMDTLFPTSDNIGEATETDGAYSGVTSTSMPALSTTTATAVADVVSTLVEDAGIVFKYAADATDLNILNPFYCSEFAENGKDTVITEDNIEQAIIPFAISALKHWNITASIHNADWDKVCDLESAAVVSLQEYLKYLYPDRDYSDLYELSDAMVVHEGDGTEEDPEVSYKFVQAIDGTTLLDHAIMPMAADALAFVLTAAGMPFIEQTSSTCTINGNAIEPLTYTFVGKGEGLDNIFWQTLNATVCYFGVDKKIAALANAPNAISYSNTIWQNANNAVNTLLPLFGSLIGPSGSSLDLQDFLWNDIVGAVADPAGNKIFTTLLTYIGNILTCAPLNNETVFNTVIFDIAKPLLNLILGSRDGTADIIRETKTTTNPINNFLLKANIRTTLNNLLVNLYGITNGTNRAGTASSNLTTASAASIHAAAFILAATHILPKLRDNTVGGVSAQLADHVVSTSQFTTRLAIRNESWGANDFYKNTANANVEAGRYYATLTNLKIYNVNSGADVTSSFTIAANAKRAGNSTFSQSSPLALAPEGFTRLDISGTNTPAAVYRVEVTYTMTRKDVLSATDNSISYTKKAVDFFSASSSSAGDVAWTDAFSGGLATNAESAQAAGLVTKVTSGYRDLYGPTLIVAGSNAGSSDYGYTIENRQNAYDSDGASTGYTGYDGNLNYATVAANTTGYKLADGTASTAANANAAWVAVDTEGNAIKGDGTTVTVASALATDGIGYIKDEDDNYIALTVATSKIGDTAATYKPGTPLAGVYLDTTSVHVDGRHEKNNQNGSAGNRIISSSSESGLSAAYNKMVINTTVGSFTLTIATGNLDSNYASLKDTATGLAAHYFTSSDPSSAVTSLIIPAMSKTLAAGVNLDNLANSLDVEAEVKALKEAAYANPTQELQDVVDMVIKARRERSNVNYTLVANYEEAVKKAKEVEELIMLDYQYETDPETGEYVTDEDGNWIPIYETGGGVIEGRYHLAEYMSYSPCIVLQEGARVFSSVYMAQGAALRTTGVFDLLYEEITHATSSTDEWDVLDGDFENDKDAFTYNKESNIPHQFPYTTKDEGEWDGVYDYTVGGNEGDPVKFGNLVADPDTGDVYLSNLAYNEETGEYDTPIYTEASWDAYIDALGECLELAQARDGTPSKNVHNAYQARSHLVICENNLELVEDEEEPDVPPVGGDDITVSGKVTIATSADGNTGTSGIGGVYIYVAGEDEAAGVTAADGTFSVTVPQGTTSLVLSNYAFSNGAHTGTGSTIDRTVTLAGTADVAYAGNIPIIVCDYNQNGTVNGADYQVWSDLLNARSTDANYNAFYDVNANGAINGADYQVWSTYLGLTASFTYPALALD